MSQRHQLAIVNAGSINQQGQSEQDWLQAEQELKNRQHWLQAGREGKDREQTGYPADY